MAKHTPGPWTREKSGDSWIIRAPEDSSLTGIPTRDIIAIVTGVYYDQEIRDKIARLIASAPELLEALYSALPFVEDALLDEGYKAASVLKTISEIKKAIAKAEGRE